MDDAGDTRNTGDLAEDGYFGESVAATYDDPSDSEEFRPDVVGATAGVLAELAGGGRALELGIGTGRIALPLAARGSRSTASTWHGRWSPGCAASPAATRSG
jgi:ubiquinone/menaquinone biosynthesis C-methylase UbiE